MAYQATFATMENSRGTHYQTSGTSVRTQLMVRDNGASHKILSAYADKYDNKTIDVSFSFMPTKPDEAWVIYEDIDGIVHKVKVKTLTVYTRTDF